MTRINLIPVNELTDQHLIAEYRELPRIFGLVLKAQAKEKHVFDFQIDKKYHLGTGHVIFFYDKLPFLQKRLDELIQECLKRNFNISLRQHISLINFNSEWKNHWKPSLDEIEISRNRIFDKILEKPKFYKHYGKLINISSEK